MSIDLNTHKLSAIILYYFMERDKTGGDESANETTSLFNQPFTAEDFLRTLSLNVSQLIYSQQEKTNGNIIRFEDLEFKTYFNPFDPRTWRRKSEHIKQYGIIVNPYLGKEQRAKSFLESVLNIKLDIIRGDPLNRTTPVVTSERKLQDYNNEIRKELEKFYAENKELVINSLKTYPKI